MPTPNTSRFGNRKVVDANNIGTPAQLNKANIGYSSKDGGGSEGGRFAKRANAKKLAESISEDTVPGIAPTQSAKGGAASPLKEALKYGTTSLAKETAYLSAVRGFDATLTGALGKLPTVKSKFTWLIKIPFIGKKIEKELEEEQTRFLAHGAKVGLFFASTYGAEKVKSEELADKLMKASDALKTLIAMDGSGAIVSTIADKIEEITSSFNEVVDSIPNGDNTTTA